MAGIRVGALNILVLIFAITWKKQVMVYCER